VTQPQAAQPDAGWSSLFRNGLGIYTVMLNLGIGLHAVDVFIVSTVMPSVVRDIGGADYYTWTTMLYMVASIIGAATGAPMKAGLGARRAYALGGAQFLVGSVGCAISPTMAAMLVARTIQGFGGGLIISLSMGLISELFPEMLRKRVLALVSSTWGVAALIGPAVGGIFAELGSWRGAFWINAPIIAGFMLAAWLRLPERRGAASTSLFPYRRMALLAIGVLAVGLASHWHNPLLQAALIALAILFIWGTLRLDHIGARSPR
jgi:MFS family permease